MKINKILAFTLTLLITAVITIIPKIQSAFADTKANQTGSVSGKVKISFNYVRQSGIASNQFAIWIEDASGNYIKTLYATRFTAKGGWKRRSDSIPGWVKAAQISGMSKKEIDAVSGPTPSAGRLVYVWDCKDSDGKPVPAGEYRYIVEGTIRWKSRAIFTCNIRIGGQQHESRAQAKFTGGNERERKMISNVAMVILF